MSLPHPQVSSRIPQTGRCSWHPVCRDSVAPAELRLKDERQRPAVSEEKAAASKAAVGSSLSGRHRRRAAVRVSQTNPESSRLLSPPGKKMSGPVDGPLQNVCRSGSGYYSRKNTFNSSASSLFISMLGNSPFSDILSLRVIYTWLEHLLHGIIDFVGHVVETISPAGSCWEFSHQHSWE